MLVCMAFRGICEVSVFDTDNKVQKFYPTKLADKTWDNTGLLVDASSENLTTGLDKIKVLLTIDLTQSVADEAIKNKSTMIVAYHPFIFKGLKSITHNDPQQRSLIKLIQNNISVYSPHTAIDSARGGVNDFLVDGLAKGFEIDSREPIEEHDEEKGCGMGRIIELSEPVALKRLVENVKDSLGLKYVQVGVAKDQDGSQKIKKIAICAGSGGSVFGGITADLFYTGEISHHQALFLTESGSSIIACNHSNTERAFLSVLKKQLQDELPEDSEILISSLDKDPLATW
ncbi:uncharacterized protein PRCAT00004178001 [Priceomyces carsonii]|uniref:uncharacterized protein n=1 Tax=Priceomyces carsonii TaxID=28549 RepID=UPI002ED9266D|nr:unnamed protein product [Priceomyces carsonii]